MLTNHEMLGKELQGYVEGNVRYKHAKMNAGFDFLKVSRFLIAHKRKVRVLV